MSLLLLVHFPLEIALLPLAARQNPIGRETIVAGILLLQLAALTVSVLIKAQLWLAGVVRTAVTATASNLELTDSDFGFAPALVDFAELVGPVLLGAAYCLPLSSAAVASLLP